MMATQMNCKVETGELDKFSIVQVEKLIVNTVQSRKYVSNTSIIFEYNYNVYIVLSTGINFTHFFSPS